MPFKQPPPAAQTPNEYVTLETIRSYFDEVLTQRDLRLTEGLKAIKDEIIRSDLAVREDLKSRILSGDEMLMQHISAQQVSVTLAFQNQKELMDNRDKAVAVAHQVAQEAARKAETALATRLEGMNEFRALITEERGSYIQRGAFDKFAEDVTTSLTEIRGRIVAIETKLVSIEVSQGQRQIIMDRLIADVAKIQHDLTNPLEALHLTQSELADFRSERRRSELIDVERAKVTLAARLQTRITLAAVVISPILSAILAFIISHH